MAATRKAKPRRKDKAGRGHDFAEVATLNDRQRLFVAYYLETMNGGDAAVRAGYSEKGAYVTASKLLRIPKILTGIEDGMRGKAMGAEEVLSRLSDHARVDFKGFTNEAGELDLAQARRLGLMRYVRKMTTKTVTNKQGTTVTRAIEVHDAQGALFKLGERHRLWRQDGDGDGTGDGKIPTLAEYLAAREQRDRERAAQAVTATTATPAAEPETGTVH